MSLESCFINRSYLPTTRACLFTLFLVKCVLSHVTNFLNVKECATLQMVTKDMRNSVCDHLSRFGILKDMLEIYHPWLKTGIVPADSYIPEDDSDEDSDEDYIAWREARARRVVEKKEYSRRHMSNETFSLIYEL